MTNVSDPVRNPQAGSDMAPLRANWGWIVALGVVYLLAGFIALGSGDGHRRERPRCRRDDDHRRRR